MELILEHAAYPIICALLSDSLGDNRIVLAHVHLTTVSNITVFRSSEIMSMLRFQERTTCFHNELCFSCDIKD